MSSLKNNILWNAVRVTSNIVFPLITFPYVSRILGPTSIGLFNYASSIAAYFILFASLGFPIYGIREVARIKDNANRFGEVVNPIFTANLIATTISFLIYFAICIFLYKNDFLLFTIVGFSIIFSCINFDWFYQGIEDFKYITTRSLIIKSISVLALFIFVNNRNDLIPYAVLSILGTVGNNIINLMRLNSYVKIKLTVKDFTKHMKGAFSLFLMSIAVSLYINLNIVMIGNLDNITSVGYFSTSYKLLSLSMTFITSASLTIIPRMSYLIGNNKHSEALILQKQTINLILYLALPIVAGLIILAKPLVLLFAGTEFLPASIILQILSILLIISSMSSFLGSQILLPLGKEKYANYGVIIGVLFNIVLNIFLIPKYSYIGAALSYVFSETVIIIVDIFFARKYMNLTIKDFLPIKAIIATAIMALIVHILNVYIDKTIYTPFWILVGATIYSLILISLKDTFFIGLIKRVVLTNEKSN